MTSGSIDPFDICFTLDYMARTTPPGMKLTSSVTFNAPSFKASDPEKLMTHIRFQNGKMVNLLPEPKKNSKKNKKTAVRTKNYEFISTSSESLFSSDTTGHTNSFYSDFESNPLIDDRSRCTTVSSVSTSRVFGRPHCLLNSTTTSSSTSSYDSSLDAKKRNAKRLRKALKDIQRKELDFTIEFEHDPNVSTASNHTFMTIDVNSIVGDDDKIGIDTEYLDLSSVIDVSSYDDRTSAAASPFRRS